MKIWGEEFRIRIRSDSDLFWSDPDVWDRIQDYKNRHIINFFVADKYYEYVEIHMFLEGKCLHKICIDQDPEKIVRIRNIARGCLQTTAWYSTNR
jgi:hypothetical protein